jgi:PLP dependent protein
MNADRIAGNVAEIRGRIADAAARSGRATSDVTLVAVTKYAPVEWIRPLAAAGCCDLGESRPQQLWQRAEELADLPIRWHLIGHLQRNKIRRTLPVVSLIHSIDSPRLAAAVNEESQRVLPVLLEVNISGEPAKDGFAPEAVGPFLAELASYKNVAVHGLMCMAGLEGDLDSARREFAALRNLRDRLRPDCPPGVSLDELSMGMSGDYEVAIEEGATIVRIGSALFEGIAPNP